jgi:lipopolysaccharide transport system permease protein
VTDRGAARSVDDPAADDAETVPSEEAGTADTAPLWGGDDELVKGLNLRPRTRKSRHSAASHRWIVRTPDADQLAASTRWSTSWPLLKMWAVRQIQLRYRQSVLGLSWTIVQPVAVMAIYGFVMTAFLDVSGDGLPYLCMAWSGLTVWQYVMGAVQQGTVSLRNDNWILSKIWFPREIVPLAPVLAGLIDLAAAGAILLVLVVVQGVGFSYTAVALPVPILVLMIWVAGLCVLTGTITIFFRDMATIVALGLRLAFIATPIMYPANIIPEGFRWINAANPFTVIIEGVRRCLLGHVWPDWPLLAFHGAIGTVVLLLSLKYLRVVERRMIDVV